MNKDVKRLILIRCDASKLIEFWDSIEELRPVISLILRIYSEDKVWWDDISGYQTLSEDFIREFKDNMSWYWIARHQTVSDDFMREEFNC